MKKTALILMTLMVCSKILGFFREMLMSFYYGAGYDMDAFVMSSSAAGIFLGWMGTVAVIHTPIFQEIRYKRGIREAERFTNQILFLQLCASVVLMFLVRFLGIYILPYIAVGFPPEKLELTADFFRWSAASTCFTAMSAILTSEKNCKGEFISANATTLLLSSSQIVFILLARLRGDFLILRFMLPFSAFLQFLALFLLSLGNNRTMRAQFPIVPEMRSLFTLLIPIFASSLMDEVNAFVDKMFGSFLEDGSIAALNYAHLLKQLCFYVFATTIVTLLYPAISQAVAVKDERRTAETVNTGMECMALIFSWTSVYLFFYSAPIVNLVYGRGAFDRRAVQLTSESLMMYGSALLPLAVREILLKSAQSYKDTKINFITGIVSSLANILLNALLVKPLRHMGLALSTSIAAFVTLPLLIFFLKRKNRDIFSGKTAHAMILILCSALLSVIPIRFLLFREADTVEWFWPVIRTLVLSALLSLALYLALCLLTGVPSVRRESEKALRWLRTHRRGGTK